MSKNEITGDSLKSKTDNQDAFASGWDLIWGNKGKTGETYAIKPLDIGAEIEKLESEENT